MTRRPPCVECAGPSHHDHHVIPRAAGGTFTVPLCERCHGVVHGIPFGGHRVLVRAGLDARKAAGKRTGSVPYGYTEGIDGTLEVNPEEQATILRARHLREAGFSLRRVAAMLAAEGRLSRAGTHVAPVAIQLMTGEREPRARTTVRSGKPFEATQVARMLRSSNGGEEKTGADD